MSAAVPSTLDLDSVAFGPTPRIVELNASTSTVYPAICEIFRVGCGTFESRASVFNCFIFYALISHVIFPKIEPGGGTKT